MTRNHEGDSGMHSSTPFFHPISQHFGRNLLVGIFILNVIVCVFAALSLQNAREHYDRQAEIQTQNLALALDQSISHSTDKINLSLRAVVYEMERQLAAGKIDLADLQDDINLQKQLLPEASGFRIFNANGHLLLGRGNASQPDANVADRDYFIYLKQHPGDSVAISKPLTSRFTGDHVITYAHRINNPNGSFAGVATIPIPLEYFRQIASKYVIGEHGVIVLRDIDFGLVLRLPAKVSGKLIEVGESNLPNELKNLLSSAAASGTGYTRALSDNFRKVFTFRKLDNMPLYAISGLAEQDYLAMWYRDVREAVAFLALFVIVTSAAAWLLYRTWKQQLQGTKILQEHHLSLKNLLQKLQESDHTLQKTQEIGKLGSFKLDIARGLFSCSAEVDSLFGIDANHPHHFEAFLKLLHPEDRQRLLDAFHENVLTKKQFSEHEYRIIRSNDGAIRWLRVIGNIELDEQQHPIAISGIVCDITEQKRYHEQLRLTNEVFVNMHEAVIITDGFLKILEVNPAFSTMAGYSREEMIGKTPTDFLSEEHLVRKYREVQETLQKEGYWEGEFEAIRKNGERYIQVNRITAIQDDKGKIRHVINVASDVTEMRASQRQIEHLAFYDRLTNLPNRAMLAERLKKAITLAEHSQNLLGVCYIDLDGFKYVNDLWGHEIGDRMLIEVAARLQSCVGADDTVARLGGDEFVVLLNGASSIGDIEQTLLLMLSALSKPFGVGQQAAELTASIGVAIYPDDVEDADLLIRRADQAMYVAKRLGKNRFHLFDSETDRRMRAHHDFFVSVTAALDKDEFRLYYQPKVDMLQGKVIGAEALIRWQHPQRGLLLPVEFLPVVENTDFSIRLGEWVITEALYQMAEWAALGLILPVSVNISGYHLQQPNFVERLATLLKKYPEVKPEWLQLEILETTAMENIEVVSDIITNCIKLGVSFALDDFGTGYSSLTYFRRLPTNMMKIDRSFVRDMLNDAEDYALIKNIVKLAQSFQREVIAEGVETVDHGLSLMKIGCHQAQGFGIARPMLPEDIPTWINGWTSPQEWSEMNQALAHPDTLSASAQHIDAGIG